MQMKMDENQSQMFCKEEEFKDKWKHDAFNVDPEPMGIAQPQENSIEEMSPGVRCPGKGRASNRRNKEGTDSQESINRSKSRGRGRRPDIQVYVPRGRRSVAEEPVASVATISDQIDGNPRTEREKTSKGGKGRTSSELYVPRHRRSQETNSAKCMEMVADADKNNLKIPSSNKVKRPNSAGGNSPRPKVLSLANRQRKLSRSTEEINDIDEQSVRYSQIHEVNCNNDLVYNSEESLTINTLTQEISTACDTSELIVKNEVFTDCEGNKELSKSEHNEYDKLLKSPDDHCESSSQSSFSSGTTNGSLFLDVNGICTQNKSTSLILVDSDSSCKISNVDIQNNYSNSHVSGMNQNIDNVELSKIAAFSPNVNGNNDKVLEVVQEGCQKEFYCSIHDSAKTDSIYSAAGTSRCSMLQACKTVSSESVSPSSSPKRSQESKPREINYDNDYINSQNNVESDILDDPGIVTVVKKDSCTVLSLEHTDNVEEGSDSNEVCSPMACSTSTQGIFAISDQDPSIIEAKCSPKASEHAESDGSIELLQQDSSIIDLAKSPEPASITADEVTMETDEEESWDALFDDDGEALDPKLMEELTIACGNVKVQKPKVDYLNFQPKEPDLDYAEYGHLIEVYDFSKELITRDLLMAFREFQDKGFDIKWVDDTHAIGVFSSAIAASSALQLNNPFLKVRPLTLATRQTKLKARKCTEFLQPYKARPQTSASVARKMVTGALGIKTKVSKEQRDEERRQLKEAKDKRREAKKQKQDVWDGSVKKCAMDDV